MIKVQLKVIFIDCTIVIVYLAIVLYKDACAECALIFGLGTGCMAAAVLLRNCSKGTLRSTQLFFH